MNSHKFNRLLQQIKYDKQAIAEIYCEYFPKIVLHLTRRFGKLISSEDIAQEVFMALMSADHFSFVKFPTTWIYTMADNKAIDKIRSSHKDIHLTENYAVPFNLDNLIIKEDIKKALSKLDQESQLIIYLHIWERYAHKEIAKLLHLSHANVRTKISRAYTVIKTYL